MKYSYCSQWIGEGEIRRLADWFENSLFENRNALPPDAMGKITYIAPAGQYSLKDTVLELEFQGVKKKYTMLQTWPIRTPCPVASKLAADTPLLTGQFIRNVHRDEPVGRELLLRLENWLCDNYMKDPLATLIVDNVHLHFLPSLNPDGFSLRRRGNANNIDLNRDFPDQVFYPWLHP
ncbi:putative H(+)-transporting two-sector ATPase [Helianthus debilis subsp. tardiflorus]